MTDTTTQWLSLTIQQASSAIRDTHAYAHRGIETGGWTVLFTQRWHRHG